MLRSEALRILGLEEGHSEQQMRDAYAAAVKRAHPDSGCVADGDAQRRVLDKAKKAKDFLAQRFKEPSSIPECEPCKGKGVIKGLSKFGTTCKACQGTGRDTRKR